MRISDWSSDVCSSDLDGRWYNNGQDNGPSPVKKIAQNAREIYIQLDAHLKKYAKGKPLRVPKVQGLVVLTKSADLSGIAESEKNGVMHVAAFTAALKSVPKRIATFGAAPPHAPLPDPTQRKNPAKFFNLPKDITPPGQPMS